MFPQAALESMREPLGNARECVAAAAMHSLRWGYILDFMSPSRCVLPDRIIPGVMFADGVGCRLEELQRQGPITKDSRMNPRRVLFIGNSFTNRNDVPGTIGHLAAAAHPPRRLESDRIIANGVSLKTHWDRGIGRVAIAAERW